LPRLACHNADGNPQHDSSVRFYPLATYTPQELRSLALSGDRRHLQVVRMCTIALAGLCISGCDSSAWETTTSTAPMTDKVFNYAAVQADNGPWRLVFECEGKGHQPFAAFQGMSTVALTDKEITGEYRTDGNPPERINIGYYGGVLAFSPFEQKPFLRSVSGKNKLAVKISEDYW